MIAEKPKGINEFQKFQTQRQYQKSEKWNYWNVNLLELAINKIIIMARKGTETEGVMPAPNILAC